MDTAFNDGVLITACNRLSGASSSVLERCRALRLLEPPTISCKTTCVSCRTCIESHVSCCMSSSSGVCIIEGRFKSNLREQSSIYVTLIFDFSQRIADDVTSMQKHAIHF